jgi:U6 snRNA-associated Sm-like protein LSm1
VFCGLTDDLEKMLVVLRDGKKIIGVLRSFDQYGTLVSLCANVANLVLQDAIERIFVGDIYGDIYAGIYVIRGENVVLLGEIVYPATALIQDLDKEDEELPQRRVSGAEAQEAFTREIEHRKRKERSQNKVLHGMVYPPKLR